MKKFLSLVLVIALLTLPMVSLAATGAAGRVDDITNAPSASINTAAINKAGNSIYNVAQTVGIVIALVVLVTFGIQWIVATPAKKAELKGKMWTILIGLVILLLAPVILKQVIDFIEAMQ